MQKLTLIIASLLIITGIIFFGITDFSKFTALIPVPFGIILGLLGLLGYKQKCLKLAMHIAAFIALLGSVPFFIGLSKLIRLLSGSEIQRPLAAVEMTLMGGICFVYFIYGVCYFIARKLEKSKDN